MFLLENKKNIKNVLQLWRKLTFRRESAQTIQTSLTTPSRERQHSAMMLTGVRRKIHGGSGSIWSGDL